MKKILYILIILIIFSSCNKTIEVPLEEQSVIAYQKNIDEESFENHDNKFYFLSEEDSIQLNYYSLTPEGVFEIICNANDYFPENYTVDSLINYKAKIFDDNSKAIAFSYFGKAKKRVSVIKLGENNQVKWQTTDTITKGFEGYSLENIFTNTNGDIEAIFLKNRPEPNLQTIIHINKYAGTNGEVVSKTQIIIDGITIQVTPLEQGGILIFSGEPEGVPGSGILVYRNLKVWLYKDDQLKSIETGLNVSSYYMALLQDQDNFIFSALTESQEETMLVSVSLENGVNWTTNFTKSEIYAIANSSDGYIITGVEYNTLLDGSILLSKIGKNGEVAWNVPFKAESYGFGIIEKEQTIYWLGTNYESVIPKSFFILKTDNQGVVK